MDFQLHVGTLGLSYQWHHKGCSSAQDEILNRQTELLNAAVHNV